LKRLLQLELPQQIRTQAAMSLANLCRSSGDYTKARKHLSAALAGDPDEPCLHHMLGYLHEEDEEDGCETRALAHLKKAVKLAPDSSECHRALGEFFFHHNQIQKAMVHLKEAVKLEPDNLDSFGTYLECLVESGKMDEAKSQLRQLQFRMGKAHPGIQQLWNKIAYASACAFQKSQTSMTTIPLPNTSRSKTKTCSGSTSPNILRFDSAHATRGRFSRNHPRR
ncbi:MAG TPA: tetratricopeptide repeat protein, partial [Gemmatales bacterium]|nr:tetratricopeptide repeat protein [Gemmatales bacterium]